MKSEEKSFWYVSDFIILRGNQSPSGFLSEIWYVLVLKVFIKVKLGKPPKYKSK